MCNYVSTIGVVLHCALAHTHTDTDTSYTWPRRLYVSMYRQCSSSGRLQPQLIDRAPLISLEPRCGGGHSGLSRRRVPRVSCRAVKPSVHTHGFALHVFHEALHPCVYVCERTNTRPLSLSVPSNFVPSLSWHNISNHRPSTFVMKKG